MLGLLIPALYNDVGNYAELFTATIISAIALSKMTFRKWLLFKPSFSDRPHEVLRKLLMSGYGYWDREQRLLEEVVHA